MIGTGLMPGGLMPGPLAGRRSAAFATGGTRGIRAVVARAAAVATGSRSVRDQLRLCAKQRTWAWHRGQRANKAFGDLRKAYTRATGKNPPIPWPKQPPKPLS